jgi:hypothetical protein
MSVPIKNSFIEGYLTILPSPLQLTTEKTIELVVKCIILFAKITLRIIKSVQ